MSDFPAHSCARAAADGDRPRSIPAAPRSVTGRLLQTADKEMNRTSTHFILAIWLGPLLFLWFRLLHHLSIEWSLNPQYRFGWAVVPLCVLLLCQSGGQTDITRNRLLRPASWSRRTLLGFGIVLALGYAGTRLIQEANPEWRFVTWALAVEVAGLTLLLWSISATIASRSDTTQSPPVSVFACAFFFVALPWPTVVERPVVGALTNAVSWCAAELLALLGIPALVHGHLIEVRSGFLEIEEACSGIRSFQASLVLGLFFGELFQLKKPRRFILVLAGVLFALFLNLIRTGCLAIIAARNGVKALTSCHDFFGVMLPLTGFVGIWCLALWLRIPGGHEPNLSFKLNLQWLARFGDLPVRSAIFPLALGVWILFVETGTEMWYRLGERQLPPSISWRIRLPQHIQGFRELPLPQATRQILRFDEGQNVTWSEDNGLRWQAIFLRWDPGRVSRCLARNHTPEDCLPAAGAKPLGNPALQILRVHGLEMPFQVYSFEDREGPACVFFCLWEDRAVLRVFNSQWASYSTRLAAVLAGQRNLGQRSLELVLRGAESPEAAQKALQGLLEQIIRPDV